MALEGRHSEVYAFIKPTRQASFSGLVVLHRVVCPTTSPPHYFPVIYYCTVNEICGYTIMPEFIFH